MGAFTYIETDTGTNVDISAATAVGAYTSTGDKLIMVDVSIDAVAGNGDYVMYVTRQIGGSGSAYRILPQTTMAAASGLTAISAQSGWITVRNGDVLTCYVDGLAGDTSTPDWTTRWFELAAVAAPDNAGIAAIQSKTDQLTFTTPNKVDATATVDTTGIATSAALAVVDANVDAIKAKTDALDVSSVTVVTAVNGSTITILRGDTFSGALTNIGALTDYVSIDFTVKESYSKTDDEATIRIRKNASGTSDGLMRLNGAAATSSALGSIAIDDLATGDITIALDETATDDLSTGNYVYDIQMISATGVKTLTYGKLIVSADVTRLVA
jgi:hypothetical protein